MKTLTTTQTLTFADTQLLIDVISIIVDENLLFDTTSNNSFTIFQNIHIALNTNSCIIKYDTDSLTEFKDVEKLLNYILIQTTNHKSLLHLRQYGSYFDELNSEEQKHVRRFSVYPFFEETPEAIYKKLVFEDLHPQELKEEFDISAKFIQLLRRKNRIETIHNIVAEVNGIYEEYLAA